MDGLIKTTQKFSLMLCWVLPHEKTEIENHAKDLKIDKSIIFTESLSELRKHIDDTSLVYLSTTRASNCMDKQEIFKLFTDYPKTQFCMGDYDREYIPMKQEIFFDPLAGNFTNVYPRMILTNTAIEIFSSGEFPEPIEEVFIENMKKSIIDGTVGFKNFINKYR
jgi:hypothetical protein